MKKLIELTRYNTDEKIYIDVDKIKAFYLETISIFSKKKYTFVLLENSDFFNHGFYVKETLEEIREQIVLLDGYIAIKLNA